MASYPMPPQPPPTHALQLSPPLAINIQIPSRQVWEGLTTAQRQIFVNSIVRMGRDLAAAELQQNTREGEVCDEHS